MTRNNKHLIAIAENMQAKSYPNSFFRHLSQAMLFADNDNRQKIANAFPDIMARFEVVGYQEVSA